MKTKLKWYEATVHESLNILIAFKTFRIMGIKSHTCIHSVKSRIAAHQTRVINSQLIKQEHYWQMKKYIFLYALNLMFIGFGFSLI